MALGGGGARGYAHIGVMRVLEREGLQPSVIAGTSMGSLVGAFFAAGLKADTVQEIITQTSFWKLLDLNPFKDMLSFGELVKLMEPHVPRNFAELAIPFSVTASDLITGTEVYFRDGDLYQAIRGSIAYPGAINPIWVENRLLSDGGILNQIPVDAVRFMGAERILAVDVTPLEALKEHPLQKSWWDQLFRRGIEVNPIQTVFRAVEIMQIRLAEVKLATSRPDIILRPKLEGIGLFSFQQVEQAIKDGEAATEASLEQIRALLLEPSGDATPRGA